MEDKEKIENAEEAKKNKNLEKLKLLKLKQKEKKEKENKKKEQKLKKLKEFKENKKENDLKKISSETKIPLHLLKNMAFGDENPRFLDKMVFEEPKNLDSEEILCPGSDEEEEKKEKEREKRIFNELKKELNLEKISAFLEKKRNKEVNGESSEEKKDKIKEKYNKKYKNFVTRHREELKIKYAGEAMKKELIPYIHPKKIAAEFFKNFLRKPEPLKEEAMEEEEEEQEEEREYEEEEEVEEAEEECEYEEEEEFKDERDRERYALFKKHPMAYNISLELVGEFIEMAINPEKEKKRKEKRKRRREKEEKMKQIRKERFKNVQISEFNFHY